MSVEAIRYQFKKYKVGFFLGNSLVSRRTFSYKSPTLKAKLKPPLIHYLYTHVMRKVIQISRQYKDECGHKLLNVWILILVSQSQRLNGNFVTFRWL